MTEVSSTRLYLGNLPRTCRHLYGFVTGNAALCRDIYYRMLVSPI